MTEDATRLVRRYYEALDEHEYETLEPLLSPSFVQRRPDRTFETRDAFVQFMREERPMTDTRHELLDVFGADDRVAVRGRLLDASGEPIFEFADLFELADGRIVRLETFTR